MYSLCERCNNLTGEWYGAAYAEFAVQGMRYYKHKAQGLLSVPYTIYPLRVLKQVVSCFASANGPFWCQEHPSIKEFLLNPEERRFPRNIDIRMYMQSNGRSKIDKVSGQMNPFTGEKFVGSEFAYPPFGFICVIDRKMTSYRVLNMKVQDITPRVVDKYIQTLQKTPAVNTKNHHAKTEFVTNATIDKIIKLLRCAFKQAVRWELVPKNPFDNVILPKVEHKKRDIWTADMIRTALDQCTDGKLYVAMNLAFACSMRMGEIMGLTWSNVHISDEDIAADNAYVYIDKELARASKRAIEMLGHRDVYYVFPPLFANTSTRIILKKPKTDSSIRKVWLPKTLAYILLEWKKSQDELKEMLRDEYQDYDLVVALPNGRPCEDRVLLKEFEKLREKAGLPKVVFHSLRHSSTTYKLKLNHGDLKATQGDTGHAQIDMITSVYAHILDEDRKVNAQKFEDAFYASTNPDLRTVRPPAKTRGPKEPESVSLDLEALVEQLRKSPELANTLAALLASAPSGK